MTHEQITFHVLSGLPLPTPLARDLMSCLTYAKAINKVEISGEDIKDRSVFVLTCRGQWGAVSSLEHSLKRPIKGYEHGFALSYIEDRMMSNTNDPSSEYGEVRIQTFKLEIDYGLINDQR